MKASNLVEAIQILSKNHSNEIIINKVGKNSQVKTSEENPTLHIKNCVASAIDNLKNAGFSLSMDNGFLSVEDYAKK